MITSFWQLIEEVKSARNRTIAVAVAQDVDVLEALQKAHQANLADAILVGNKAQIEVIITSIWTNLKLLMKKMKRQRCSNPSN